MDKFPNQNLSRWSKFYFHFHKKEQQSQTDTEDTVLMGISSSSRRRRDDNHHQQYPPPPALPPPPVNYDFTGAAAYHPPAGYGYNHPYPAAAPPPYNPNYYQQPPSVYSSAIRLLDQLMGRRRYPQYYGTYPGGEWSASAYRPSLPSSSPASSSAPAPFVEHHQAKTVKNGVNVHKDTIRLDPDLENPDHLLVSFVFDALADGSVTIYYFAKEGTNCSFIPVYADMYSPMKVPFTKGVGQKFHQPSGHGIDLGFFELDDLSKPLNGDVYPLVICAEACQRSQNTDEKSGQPAANSQAQITQAIIEKHRDSFQPKVVKRILWTNGERYELQEIFGLVNSSEADDGANDDLGKECVICLSEPRDTMVFPCRHLCMCSECASELKMRSNKCPICREPVEKLIEIKVNRAGQ